MQCWLGIISLSLCFLNNLIALYFFNFQVKTIKKARNEVHVSKVAPIATVAISHTKVYPKAKTDHIVKKEHESEEVEWPGKSEETLPFISEKIRRCDKDCIEPKKEDAGLPSHSQSPMKQGLSPLPVFLLLCSK